MISRDPLVGPWQVPVSDVAVTVNDYFSTHGEAMAMGERTPLALLDAAASGRMAVAEAITNIVAADVRALGDVRLSANWMAACGEPGEDADLYDTVHAVGEEFCPALGIAIPVGKDSLSMKTAGARRCRAQGRRAGVADRLGVRAGRRRAPHADAAAARPIAATAGCCSSISGAAATGSAVRASRRSTARIGDEAPDCDDPQRAACASSRPSASLRDEPDSCSRITIARTAACS